MEAQLKKQQTNKDNYNNLLNFQSAIVDRFSLSDRPSFLARKCELYNLM